MNTLIATTRRRFLQSMAAAGAAPLFLPSSKLFGQEAPSRALNIALIGCGSRANGQFGLPQAKGVNLIAMVDPIRSRRESFAARYNQIRGNDTCKAYADFREIIGREDLDGIVVATPDHWHVPIAMEAARHDKDMYVEKPLGVSLNDQFRLRALFEGKDIVFQYGTQQRSGLFARTAVELVRNGYIGEVTEVDVWSPARGISDMDPFSGGEQPVPEGLDYDLFVGPSELLPYHPGRVNTAASWHSYNYAIGFIAGWGAHPLDICQWGLDMDGSGPVHYEGTGVLPDPRSLHNTTRAWDIHCRYPNGVKMRFMDASTAKPVVQAYSRYWRGDGTVFKGTEGWVQFSRGAIYLFKDGDYVNASRFAFRDTDERVCVSNNHMGNFLDCMRSRQPTINPLESAIRSDTISHLSDIVVRTGKPVSWDPKTETLIGPDPVQQELTRRDMRPPYVF